MSYFTLTELTKTDTKLPNMPNDYATMSNLLKLWAFLDTIRSELGLPITVNSAYRSKDVNAAVGGVPTSNHLKGLAADIKCKHMAKLATIIQQHQLNGEIAEFIIYKTFYHVAIYSSNRRS